MSLNQELDWNPQDFQFVQPYCPPRVNASSLETMVHLKPFVTVTYAQSMDSMLAAAQGVQTHLSGGETKRMTHALRSCHDAILIGVNTALADDPGLNCRLQGMGIESQPRPIILDPKGRWNITKESRIMQAAASGLAKAPWIITDLAYLDDERADLLDSYGGAVIPVTDETDAEQEAGQEGLKFKWEDIMQVLTSRGIRSLMVEGGATVINELLSQRYRQLVDSVIITIAPVWLGEGGVRVEPLRWEGLEGENETRLMGVTSHRLGNDTVVCGRVKRESDVQRDTNQAE